MQLEQKDSLLKVPQNMDKENEQFQKYTFNN
jgi:hypothetical protein